MCITRGNLWLREKLSTRRDSGLFAGGFGAVSAGNEIYRLRRAYSRNRDKSFNSKFPNLANDLGIIAGLIKRRTHDEYIRPPLDNSDSVFEPNPAVYSNHERWIGFITDFNRF